MKLDFTLSAYKELLSLFNQGDFTFSNTITNNGLLIIRHDVDSKPQRALNMAALENSIGIASTYYFRVLKQSFSLNIMQKIAELGHEIGYHYEDVDLIVKKLKTNGTIDDKDLIIDAAYDSFCKNLIMFRENFDIKSICMHGSPRSKYDNKMIWDKYDYRELGIIGEPYFDIDFNEFAYFTDTGRRWNAQNMTIRDRVNSKYQFNFKNTQEIIEHFSDLPEKMMFTVHPERWNDEFLPWFKELLFQNFKNIVKYGLVKISHG